MPASSPSLEASLAVLYRLGQTILDADDEKEILELVAQAPVQVLDADRVCVITFTPDGEVDQFVHTGPGSSFVHHVTRAELDAGLTGWVLREGQVAVSPAGQDDPRESAEIQRVRRETQCGHIVVLPLAHKERMLGTLTVVTGEHGVPFTPEELEWFGALANLAALTLQQRRLYRQLAHLAQFDALTNLPNRSLFEDRLNQALARTIRSRTLCAVLYLDLDGFKDVNDQWGHDVGDQVLCEVAVRLQGTMRATDTVARMGGDEFVVILGDLRSIQDAVLVAEKLRAALCQPIRVPNMDVTLSASIGVSVALTHAQTPEALCRLADQAMYQAKRHGKNLVWLAQMEGLVPNNRRAQLEQDLLGALTRGEFSLHYQEQFGAQGERTGFEALTRWTSPQWGEVSPAEFIPISEESGAIVHLGAWVLTQATTQLAKWHAEGLTDAMMAVNVSPVQFLRPDFEDSVIAALQRAQLPPHALELKLTENFVASHLTIVAPRLKALRSMGVRIALDDFGAGASVLSQLLDLPLDTLKIDRSFLRQSGVPKAHRVMGAITAFARALNLEVVLEGVETPEHLVLAHKLGCDRTQGYLQGRPAPPEVIERRFSSSSQSG
ncbi:putative bifunctional diguanylate cyclase/phosphodiesterase [Deinococcus hopiensis]|uniref:Diguanylate cyclase (GGDEF) domain-containing protein n=1 Tax=Deinococcus hopiensis KR-140 TaxID=695939 RepID=A0A1W1VWP7_9DEIO|nr:EAL domain-containing protein [Deinococcus hopiensis]SMB97680.1 diguanylate cyclase (GGDEF) domain-containing protein [Deinococcus hopiensis KR-140]